MFAYTRLQLLSPQVDIKWVSSRQLLFILFYLLFCVWVCYHCVGLSCAFTCSSPINAKKVNSLNSSDSYVGLWRNYLILCCSTASSSTSMCSSSSTHGSVRCSPPETLASTPDSGYSYDSKVRHGGTEVSPNTVQRFYWCIEGCWMFERRCYLFVFVSDNRSSALRPLPHCSNTLFQWCALRAWTLQSLLFWGLAGPTQQYSGISHSTNAQYFPLWLNALLH